ncbi:hypothetical protein [Kitasatospora sp. NPDC094016]|uniref:hypothetical protein n=1 Tax=Kitasatospora sp. NPDC094016 TaxID=3154986 RepID=UPI00332476EC
MTEPNGARETLPLDVVAADAAVRRADEIATQAQQHRPPDDQALALLAEELIGHLMLLLTAAAAEYEALPPGARLRPVVDGAARAAGSLLARPGPATVANVLVLAGACRLLLVLHLARQTVAAPRRSS